MLQVKASHYRFLDYETAGRFASYWYQIRSILSVEPKSVMEVGVGSGISRYLLQQAGVPVTTVDIDPELKPDFVADVRSLPFTENQFDVTAAFQILEHLPFTEFVGALSELRRVAARYVCISLPDAGQYIRFQLRLGNFREFGRNIDISRFTNKPHVFGGQHHWEINKKGYEIGVIRQGIASAQLKIKQEHRLYQNMYHRFFVLEK